MTAYDSEANSDVAPGPSVLSVSPWLFILSQDRKTFLHSILMKSITTNDSHRQNDIVQISNNSALQMFIRKMNLKNIVL
jgi:hypothetical protein